MILELRAVPRRGYTARPATTWAAAGTRISNPGMQSVNAHSSSLDAQHHQGLSRYPFESVTLSLRKGDNTRSSQACGSRRPITTPKDRSMASPKRSVRSQVGACPGRAESRGEGFTPRKRLHKHAESRGTCPISKRWAAVSVPEAELIQFAITWSYYIVQVRVERPTTRYFHTS